MLKKVGRTDLSAYFNFIYLSGWGGVEKQIFRNIIFFVVNLVTMGCLQ